MTWTVKSHSFWDPTPSVTVQVTGVTPMGKSEAESGVQSIIVVPQLSLALGLGLKVSAEHDPFRELYGLAANGVTGGLYMDLRWVPGFLQRNGNE